MINPSFLGAFMGTTALSLSLAVLALLRWSHPASTFFMVGGVCYIAGTFLVTMFGNVPLNNRLAAVSPTDAAIRDVWEHYLDRWTVWNHVRTVAAMAAALLYTIGLIQDGGA